MRPVRSRHLLAAAATVGILAMAACSGGGSADKTSTGGSTAPTATGAAVRLFAYSVPKQGYSSVIPAFQQTDAGRSVTFEQSYGASGDQSRKVEAGAPADVVSFSLEPDVTRLVKAGLVDAGWNAGPHQGVPFGSVVVIVVRKGNPKAIKSWDDLLKPGVDVVTPNPFSSGSAKWNLLAPYAAKSNGGQDRAAGLAYVRSLVKDHVRVQPKSASEATETFLQGTGDVLLSYENEALRSERAGDPVEHVLPEQTFRIDNPVAVLKASTNKASAQAFVDFLYTPAAQELWGKAGFRPVDEKVAAPHTADFPAPAKLWTIGELGGWKTVDADLFDKDKGAIAVIYSQAKS